MIVVRDPRSLDEGAWRSLWADYLAFYRTELAEETTAWTWSRILAPDSPVLGRLAELDGQVVGFSVSVLHEGAWTMTPVCYLEDLFVAPEARGAGVGRALVRDLVDMAKAVGWARLYWHTEAGNPARKLYDQFTAADDYVRYRIAF